MRKRKKKTKNKSITTVTTAPVAVRTAPASVEKKETGSRVMWFATYLKWTDKNGVEHTFDVHAAYEACLRHKVIKRFAIIEHNHCIWTQAMIDDYIARGKQLPPNVKPGDPVDKHIHFLIDCGTKYVPYCDMSQWLGIAEHMIEKVKGKTGFINCLHYLVHEDAVSVKLGKQRYDDSEVICNFNFRETLNVEAKQIDEYGVALSLEEDFLGKVRFHGWTKSMCKNYDPVGYRRLCVQNKHFEKDLKGKRDEYLLAQPQPNFRLNIFVSGACGGVGKSSFGYYLGCLLARRFRPPEVQACDVTGLSVYEVKEKKIAFDEYDGQPVLLWPDFRGDELLSFFNDNQRHKTPGALNAFFESHPRKNVLNAVHIKYGITHLLNYFNIVDALQPYDEFIQQICASWTDDNGVTHNEDWSQGYRRFPVAVYVDEETYQFAVIDDPQHPENVSYSPAYQLPMRQFNEMTMPDDARMAIMERVLQPLVDVIEDSIKIEPEMTYDEALAACSNYGQIVDMPDVIPDNLEDAAMDAEAPEREGEEVWHKAWGDFSSPFDPPKRIYDSGFGWSYMFPDGHVEFVLYSKIPAFEAEHGIVSAAPQEN